MHALVINWQDVKNPFAGGAEIYLFEIFGRLARRGHRITLLCSGFPGAPAEETIDGIRAIRTGGRNTFNFSVPAALRALCRHTRFDLVVDDLNKIPFFSPRIIRRPVLALLMHLFRKDIFKEVSLPFARYVYAMENLIPWGYHNTNFAVLSPSSRRDLLAFGLDPARIQVIPPGIDLGRFRPDFTKKGAPIILHTGRLKRYKGVDQLVRAAVVLKQARVDFQIVIAGDGDDRSRLERLSAELGVADRVRFLGYVSEQEKISLYQRAALLVETSVKEGWGMIVIEANGCGTPVVAADSPGLRDSVVDRSTGLLYRYGDVADLARQVERLIGSADERHRLGMAGVEWARRFSWDAAADRMEDLMKKTVGEN